MAIGLQRQSATIFVIQLYFRTGETLQPPLNAEILSHLLPFLEQLQAPYIVGADWQNEPEALAATVIQSRFKALILNAQGSTTLQGSMIDYLVSESLVSSLTVRADWDVPWKPHCGILVDLNCEQQFSSSKGFRPLVVHSNYQQLGPVFGRMTDHSTSWANPSLVWDQI